MDISKLKQYWEGILYYLCLLPKDTAKDRFVEFLETLDIDYQIDFNQQMHFTIDAYHADIVKITDLMEDFSEWYYRIWNDDLDVDWTLVARLNLLRDNFPLSYEQILDSIIGSFAKREYLFIPCTPMER